MSKGDDAPLAIDPAMARHYASGAELGRLEQVNPLEFERSKVLLSEHLPAAGRIIDVGGGPGTYAAWLADLGYDVDLIDPIPLHVQEALARGKSGALFRAQVGDARDLPFASAEADAVVMMGPLFHLTDPTDRHRALVECHRVLRPGGTLLASAMGRFFLFYKGVAANVIRDPEARARLVSITSTGMRPSSEPPFPAYAHRAEDLEREVSLAGFVDVRVHAIEGIFHLLGDLPYRMADPPSRQALLDVMKAYEEDPSMTGISGHLMATARSPEG